MTGRALAFLVPEGIDDPDRVSGGNVYDRQVRDGLRDRGWGVSLLEAGQGRDAAAALRTLPDGSTVLVDGLVALWAPEELAAASTRMRIVMLSHMVAAAFPDATASTADAERRALAAAHRIVVTSPWTARELERRGLATPKRMAIAVPGADRALGQAGDLGGAATAGWTDLLCVGVIAPHKGQDLLLAALDRIPDRHWNCRLVGSPRAHRSFASAVARDARRFSGRVRLSGVLDRGELEAEYRRAALLVAPSRVESSGMAIAEARAHGVPVLAAAVGGIPDTVGSGGALLVPPDDVGALAAALDRWMADPGLRHRVRAEAQALRSGLPSWSDTITAVAGALVPS